MGLFENESVGTGMQRNLTFGLMLAFMLVAGVQAGTKNVTVYRLTPINYTGVTNMDTGDAAGDVMFGLNQLLLPQLCPLEPDFTWWHCSRHCLPSIVSVCCAQSTAIATTSELDFTWWYCSEHCALLSGAPTGSISLTAQHTWFTRNSWWRPTIGSGTTTPVIRTRRREFSSVRLGPVIRTTCLVNVPQDLTSSTRTVSTAPLPRHIGFILNTA